MNPDAKLAWKAFKSLTDAEIGAIIRDTLRVADSILIVNTDEI